MLITKERMITTGKDYWEIRAGKDTLEPGVLSGVTKEELLELALEIVPKLDEKQLSSLDACVESEWINKWMEEDELREAKDDTGKD